MNSRASRFLFCVAACLIISFHCLAQHEHFVYIQTENRQPFSIRFKNKVYSSTASGYLILAKLPAGQYSLRIGFPNDEWPAQDVNIIVKGDEGYLLKKFEGDAWGLFNTLSLEILKGVAVNVPAKEEWKPTGNQFSDALAGVTKSPVSRAAAPLPPQDKSESVVPLKTESFDVLSNTNLNSIRKMLDVIDATGRSLAYAVTDQSGTDTIRVLIPYSESFQLPEKIGISVSDSPSQIPVQPAVIHDVRVTDGAPAGSARVEPVNQNCKGVAAEADFLRLQKKMFSVKDADLKIGLASKAVRAKCYATAQVHELGQQFATDAERYRFFDAVYNYVSDQVNYGTLQADLKDEYYVRRFRAMLH